MSSVTRILGVLGMIDDRTLVFADKGARYDSVRDAAVFDGKDGDRTIRCAISREALDDHFDGHNEDPIKVLRANRARIEHEALRKYLEGRTETDGSILIRTGDLL